MNNRSVTFITGNENKVAQLSRHFGVPIKHHKLDLTEVQSTNVCEVAEAKAREAFRILGTPVLVEDTALTFTAWKTLPGAFVKWFLNSVGNEGMTKMLNAFDDRTAVATVCFAVCDGVGSVKLFTGDVFGSIAAEPTGENGFGWDPIFIPNGYNKTWAQMDVDLQHTTSMRVKPLEELAQYLRN